MFDAVQYALVETEGGGQFALPNVMIDPKIGNSPPNAFVPHNFTPLLLYCQFIIEDTNLNPHEFSTEAKLLLILLLWQIIIEAGSAIGHGGTFAMRKAQASCGNGRGHS